MLQLFEDRADAGRQLAERLAEYSGRAGVLVLGLPRGGVPVACEVAVALGLPIDVFTACKLGVPGHEELAMGAVASGDVRVLNRDIVSAFDVPDAEVQRRIAETADAVRRCERRYRGDRPPVDVHGSTVILVDDGIATGATMRAAISALRAQEVQGVVVAAPVAAFDSLPVITREADEVVVLSMPARFRAVGAWYREFPQLRDDDVRAMLERAAQQLPEEARQATRRRTRAG